MMRIVTPNYEAWEQYGKIVEVSGNIFQVAPENLLHEDGNPWFYYDEAVKFGENAPNGWHLPTPTEALLIAVQVSYDKGLNVPNGNTIGNELHMDLVGTGISLGNGSVFLEQDVGNRVAFWTNGHRVYDVGVGKPMQSGYTLMLRNDYAKLYTLPTSEHGACVRLVRLIRNK